MTAKESTAAEEKAKAAAAKAEEKADELEAKAAEARADATAKAEATVAYTEPITDPAELAEMRRRLGAREYLGDNIVYAPYSVHEFQRIPDDAAKLLQQPAAASNADILPQAPRFAISREYGVHDPGAMAAAAAAGPGMIGGSGGGPVGQGTSSTAGDTSTASSSGTSR